ncbi:MAG: elongation factor G [Planctomycetaceae bacterium]|nr:elongation factor G [Planctomycetaceae bacterium]
MSMHQVGEVRNIVLVGHGAVGKTTLADRILFKEGVNSRAGSPEEGTSFLDTDDDEKARKHTIASHVCHVDHGGIRINLIDCPGMPDFAGQVIGSLRAVETALVVISAPAGIEVNSRKAFRNAGRDGRQQMLVISKCDADNTNLEGLLESIHEQFGPQCVPINIPLGTGANLRGVANVLKPPENVDGAVFDIGQAREHLIDAAVEADEELMMRYLDGEQLGDAELNGAIRKAIVARTLTPIFFVSAKGDIGVAELLDGLAAYAPSPADIPSQVLEGDEPKELYGTAEGPLVAQVFKTRIDPFVGRMSFLRIYSGTLHKDASVHLERTGKNIKLHQLMELQGAHHEQVAEAGPGDIVVAVKVDDLKTGDTITCGADGVRLPKIQFPKPMVGLAVEPKSQADQAKISTALHKIEEEDPTFEVHREEQTHEMVIQGMSELHLQLVQQRLHDREKVDVVTHLPHVPYRETVMGAAEGSYRHKKQSGGSGQFAEVHMRVSACPQDVVPEEYFTKDRFAGMRSYHYDPELNFCFVDRVSGGSVPNQFIPAVEKGVKERMTKGALAGNQIQDIVVELFFGKDHPVDSNETAFRLAASYCLREIFQQAKPALLEPVVALEITIPSDKIGDITSDLNTRRGRMEGMDELPGNMTVVHAKAPLAEVMTYARNVSSLTAGQGSFTLEFSHYEMVPGNEQAKIIAAAKQEEEAHH